MRCALLGIAAMLAIGCGTEAPAPAGRLEPAAGESLGCTYWPRATAANPEPELDTFSDCAVREGGEIRLAAQHLAAIDFDAGGLAAILIAGRWHLIRANGAMLPVVTWDNGPDEFSDGLVRTPSGGKIAYADASFEIVVPPRYDWGWPFEAGRALVCRGCRAERIPGEEHTSVVGGTWGVIDRQGHEVVPVELSREQARGELEKLLAEDPGR